MRCWLHKMSEHVTKFSKKKGQPKRLLPLKTSHVLAMTGMTFLKLFFPKGVLMLSFCGHKILLCCLLKRTSLTGIHKLLINLLVVHQVNITVLNSLWRQICTDGVISRLGDDKTVFLQRLQERKQTKKEKKTPQTQVGNHVLEL